MLKETRPNRVLWCQSLGFLAIIAVCLLDEWVGLSALILDGNAFISDFRESALKMLLVLSVWLLVSGATRRVIARMDYLESFVRVCSWCRRVRYKDRWVRFEVFFKEGFDTPTTHGICDECLKKAQADTESTTAAISATPAPGEVPG